jgi:hypothetical protein
MYSRIEFSAKFLDDVCLGILRPIFIGRASFTIEIVITCQINITADFDLS